MGFPPSAAGEGATAALTPDVPPDQGQAQGDQPPPVPRPPAAPTETATVREIVAKLDRMPRDQARFLAAFAYVLGRTASGDLHVTDDETRVMEQIVGEHGHIDEAQAVIVVEIAKTRADLFGATE